jgi:SAM-dependent methyltransferase
LLSEFLGLLPEQDEWILDVGCYDGYFLSHVTCHLKVAVDLEPAQDGFYPVWKADGRYLPFAEETFDRVYLLDVIEHVADYGRVLTEAARVLRSGGTMWISTPSLYWWVVPPFLTGMLDRFWGHVRRGHTVEDIQAHLPPTYRVTPVLWSMPYFRSLYFLVRALWSLWPTLGRRLLAWIAQRDRRSPPGRHGHLFIRVAKCVAGA